MAANLQLEVNASSFSANHRPEPAIRDLRTRGHTHQSGAGDAQPNYRLLGLVLCMHMLAAIGVMTSRPDITVIDNDASPMTVSIISAPTSNTEPEPVQQPSKTRQIKIEKTMPINNQKALIAEPTSQELPTLAQNNAEQAIQPAPAEKISVAANAAEPTTHSAALEKTETEPVVEPPRFGAAYLNNPAPSYPPLSRRLGEQGRVLLKVLVSESGSAEKVQIESSSGHEKLDLAAIEAVKKWSFIPAKRSNQPISAYVLVPIKFSLNS